MAVPVLAIDTVLSRQMAADDYKGQIPTAFIVLKEGRSTTADEIRNFCRQSLSDYKVPKQIRFVDSLPRTGSGQIDRKQLSLTKEN